MNSPTSGKHIAVIGAGVVGVYSALYLQRAGFRVTLIDRDGAGEGDSLCNGTVIGDEKVTLVAMP